MTGVLRPVHPSELLPGYYTAARVRSALGCVAYNFFPVCHDPGTAPRRRLRFRMAWWYAKEQTRSFALHLFDFGRRDLRAHLVFMRAAFHG